MPIRTNRGRAAVYRRLWGWPLRSPRHLIGAFIGLAVILTALGITLPKVVGKQAKAAPLLPGTTTSEPAAHPSGLAAPVPTTATLPTRLSAPLETPTPTSASPDALQVATNWANAWVNHPAGITNAQWLDGLRPYTTDEYLPVMKSVDPSNIPASKVIGPPSVTSAYPDSVHVTIPTDGLKLAITVINTSTGWRVADYDQAS